MKFDGSFEKVCGELERMLQAGVVKPSGAALSAEQPATFKAGLVKHLPLPGEAAHASLGASEASRCHIRSLAKSPARWVDTTTRPTLSLWSMRWNKVFVLCRGFGFCQGGSRVDH